MGQVKEKVEKLSDFLRENEIPHLLFVGYKDETMLSMRVSSEDMFEYLMSAVREVPELKGAIIAAAEQMRVKIVPKPTLLN